MIEADPQRVELLGVRPIDADLDLVQPAVDQSLCDFASQQIAVGKDLDLRNAGFFAVTNALRQLFVDERFSVTVEMHQPNSTLDALLHDRFKKLLLHVSLRSTYARARAKHAVSLAVVGGLNPYRLGEGLPQQCHRVGDDIRSHRSHRTHQGLSQGRHFLFLAASRKNPSFRLCGKLANFGCLRQPQSLRGNRVENEEVYGYFFNLYAIKSS